MWLPRPLYEAIPYASVGAGVGAFALAWFAESAPRGWLFLAGTLLATVGLVIWMKRRDYRSTQAGYDPRAIDEQASSPSRSSSGPASPSSDSMSASSSTVVLVDRGSSTGASTRE